MRLTLWQMCVVCLAVPAALLLGQEVTGNGSVTGRITDPTGATVPDATVTLVDESTNIPITVQSNSSGLYIFNDVAPGKYDLTVTKAGFRKSVVTGQEVVTGTGLTLNVPLEIGATSETVEVKEVLGAELQTESATMGSSLGGNAILQLPTISRDVSSLVFLQPTSAPTFNGAENNITSGNIAGNPADQNTFMLDGGNNTSDLDGDNATYVGHNGSGVIPTPAESVEEFRVNTNNETADFSMSGGGQVMVSTKRGTNTFHGAAYDFFQADWLNSNDWSNNYNGIPKPKAHFNRFGGALGGPLGPEFLGGKTYFYTNYEGQRYPRSGPFTALVPTATLRQGIIQERDANGNIVQYNLATSTACGLNGGVACDPRGIGLNPVVGQIWSKYEPTCNNFNYGDNGLNTCGYNGNLTFPLTNDFGVARLDHDFGSKWRFFSSYRIYKNVNPTTDQVDVGGILPGDKLGSPATVSSDIQQPRSFVAGITGTLSPTLTNEFHFSYLRNQWQWLRAGALANPGYPGAIEIGGENGPGAGLLPLNVNTQQARQRLWDGHDYEYRDSVSKLWGTHLIQAGGDFFHQHWKFDRYDDVGLGLTSLVYDVSADNVSFTPNFQPIPCSATLTANCLPSTEIGSWNGLYGQVAGLVGASSIVVTRTGANLTANPIGTPVHSFVGDQTWSIYFNDTWKIKPNFTLTYGLNYQVQMPPVDANGVQDILTNSSGSPITAQSYLAARLAAANSGTVYNPILGFTPIGDVKSLGGYPYHPFYGEISPRVSIAWSPNVTGGWLSKILGDKSTVIRAGYGRFYTRNLGINLVSTPVLGDGFLQPVACVDPTSSGTCTQSSGTDPSTAFRIGVDGVPPVGNIPQTLTVPVEPNINAAFASRTFTLDSNYKPGSTDSIDFSIQRQFKGGYILELGYVGVYARNLFQGIDLNDVPWFMKLNGQTFANAYDNLYFQLHGNQAITPQPFLEAALKGSSYCSGFSSCTAAVAANESGNITTQSVTNLWSDLDTSFNFGKALISSTQAGFVYDDTSIGYSNYNAGVASLQKRGQNLNLVANFTWSKALGLVGINQAYTEANINDPWNPGVDYGPQYFDRKFTFNFLTSYNLPFGKGQHWSSSHTWVNEIIGGWIVSPIFSYGSGLPLSVYTGSNQEFGEGYTSDNGCNAIPLSNTGYSNSPVFGVVSNGVIGVQGDQSQPGGTGVNLFGNPAAVYNNFRPALVGIDGRCGGAGILRGQQRWNLDLGLTKDTTITERVGIQFYAQAFNVFNHMMWADPNAGSPALSLQNPAAFGVLNSQYNALGLGGGGAAGEYTRIIQLGVRIRF
ncbi:MAG: carboxypeptidase regulatory-like domain-containing protein [Acidobacteriaceae bacterium]|nr:carboxypeptidase regulatory-like domain-containing protein [Acidobacteriaceae bacterium]